MSCPNKLKNRAIGILIHGIVERSLSISFVFNILFKNREKGSGENLAVNGTSTDKVCHLSADECQHPKAMGRLCVGGSVPILPSIAWRFGLCRDGNRSERSLIIVKLGFIRKQLTKAFLQEWPDMTTYDTTLLSHLFSLIKGNHH